MAGHRVRDDYPKWTACARGHVRGQRSTGAPPPPARPSPAGLALRGRPDRVPWPTEAWGAEGDAPLRRLTTGVVLQAIQRRLGGQLVEWRRDEVMVARSRFVALGRGSGSRWLRWRPGLYGSAQRDFRPAGIYGCGRRRRRPRRRLALGVTPSSRFRSPARRRRPHGFRGHFDRCAPDGPLQVAIVVRRRAS